ncbi:MAG: Fic/DOC family protein [Vulcanibacillus sp.]
MNNVGIEFELESIKATMAYEDMYMTNEEIDICRKVISGEILADKVCKIIVDEYTSGKKSFLKLPNSNYCYPGSNVLINNLNIKNYNLLKEVERKITSVRLAELKIDPIQNELDISYLKEIHKRLFQDIYTWAGEFRTVRISKGFMFAYPENIETESGQLISKLKKEDYLRDLPKESLAERLSYYKTELNVLHHFREGNGRTLREFIQVLAKRNNYILLFKELDKDKYMRAMIQSPFNDTALKEFMNESLIIDCEK